MKPIAITPGDPAGIGPEVIAHALRKHPEWQSRVVVLGPKQVLNAMQLGEAVNTRLTPDRGSVTPGDPGELTAKMALDALDAAAEGTVAGEFSGVVTGPISKEWCQKAGMIHAGQTEFFAEKWKGSPTMAFYSHTLIVSLVTWHIPLMSIRNNLTESALRRTVQHTWDFLKRLCRTDKGIGVCGLNPHAGESGQIGSEEQEFLNPWLSHLEAEGYPVTQCQPADTLFYRHINGDFDAVIALYHDQGLAPLKTVAFHDAVNVTLGLPYLRMSPDHGTAYSIAGRGLANSGSFEAALGLMLKLSLGNSAF